jgi:hypothetical protein
MAGISNETVQRLMALWPDMCARLAAGDLVRDIYKGADVSPFQAAMFKADHPAQRTTWDQARQASADSFYDEAMAEARADVDKEYAQHVRTRIDTLKWAARIRNPAAYSDKSSVDVNVRTVDLTAIIKDANARLAASKQGRIIEHDTVNITDAGNPHAHAQPAIEHAALVAAGLL